MEPRHGLITVCNYFVAVLVPLFTGTERRSLPSAVLYAASHPLQRSDCNPSRVRHPDWHRRQSKRESERREPESVFFFLCERCTRLNPPVALSGSDSDVREITSSGVTRRRSPTGGYIYIYTYKGKKLPLFCPSSLFFFFVCRCHRLIKH